MRLAIGNHSNDGEITDIQNLLTGGAAGQVLTSSGGNSLGWAAAGVNIATTSSSMTAAAGQTIVVTSLSSDVLITLPVPALNATVAVIDGVGKAGGGGSGSGTGKHLAVNVTGGAIINNVTQVLFLNDGGAATFASDGSQWYTLQGEDQVAPDPRSISGLQCWYDASRGYTLSNTGSRIQVTALADQSGNGNNLTGTVDFDGGGPGGRSRMLFDGTQSLNTGTMTPSAGTCTILAVGGNSFLGAAAFSAFMGQNANNTAATGFAAFVNVNPTAGMRGFVSNSGAGVGVNGANGAASGAGYANANVDTILNPHLWTITIDSTTPYTRVDAITTTNAGSTTAQSFTPTSGSLYVGQSHFNGAGADFWRGSGYEFFFYSPSVPTATLFAVTEYYAMKKYGLRI